MAAAALTPAEETYVLSHTPGLPPPSPDIVPNFVNPPSRAYLSTDATVVTLVVSTLLVVIRTYTKRFIHKAGLGLEDYLSILAWAGFVAYAVVGYQTIRHGGFVHQWDVPVIEVMKFLQVVDHCYILYGPVVLITKLSILVQLLRIFAPIRSGPAYYLCHIMIWFNVLFYTVIMFVVIFMCSPRAKFWNPTLPGKCVNINTVNIITSVINAASDIVLLLLPITCTWALQMSLRQKIGVSAVFATASFACLSSIMRIVTSVQMVGEKDVTWALLNEGCWALGEIGGGIICGCMPSLPQFFRHFIPKITTALSSGSRGKSGKVGALAERSDRLRTSKAAYPKSPYGETDSYLELDEQSQQFKTFGPAGSGPRVWSDEVVACDEENALTPIAKHGVAHTIKT